MSTERRITLIIEGTYPWYRGGVSEWIWRYLLAFPDYDFDVIQVATDPYRKSDLKTALYKIPPQIKSFFRIAPPSRDYFGYPQLEDWYGEYKTGLNAIASRGQLIHVTNTGFAGWLGAMISSDAGRPLLLTEHALYWKEVESGATALECGYQIPANPEMKTRLAGLFRKTARQIYGQAHSVVSVSRVNMPDQKRLGADDPQYIPNGVPDEWITAPVPRRLKTSPILTIGWIGRCAEIKNPLLFFDVVDAVLARRQEEVRFIMMLADSGENDLASRVEKEAVNHSGVKLIWNQPAINYLHSMDALCITSHNESQPLVLFEALARGVMPFGWKVGDADDSFGIFIDRGKSADNISRVLLGLLNHPSLWNKELDQRMAFVRQHHTWKSIFAEYRTLFDQLIA